MEDTSVRANEWWLIFGNRINNSLKNFKGNVDVRMSQFVFSFLFLVINIKRNIRRVEFQEDGSTIGSFMLERYMERFYYHRVSFKDVFIELRFYKNFHILPSDTILLEF